MAIDYPSARALLDQALTDVSRQVLAGGPPTQIEPELETACNAIFDSNTQAYREVLLGMLVAKMQDSTIDVRKPYVNMGDGAYNGRTMDERVVNPFFQHHRIPSSRGPYLSVFRRSVTFGESTRAGVRDKTGFDALLRCVASVESTNDAVVLTRLLHYLLFRFIGLREASSVPLSRLQRFSLPQYSQLIERLMMVPSGGRFPMFLVVSAFQAISDRFSLQWDIGWQGINVADGASGAGGDISVRSAGVLLMAAEVTERVVGRDRVVSTFNTKIAPSSIEDYLFFVSQEPDDRVRQQCHQYFAQGHEVSFVQMAGWLNMMLVTIGKRGRETFNN